MADFEDIRPYTDEELPAAVQRIATHPLFGKIAEYIYPNRKLEDVQQMFFGFRSIYDFQHVFIADAVEAILSRTVDSLTYDGRENLVPGQNYLFISNHRDIVLDAAFQAYILDQWGFDTPEISFGANLMQDPVVVDLGKSNKMYRVARPDPDKATAREFYRLSMHLSEYIRYTICNKHNSVWIAQRNGRTKNGLDKTDPGIIKMFAMSGSSDNVASFSELKLAPVSVSYEWEPCDRYKAAELYKSSFTTYVKQPGEDLNSMLTGILQPKGRVHIHFCKPIGLQELESCKSDSSNTFRNALASLIDERIHAGYKLFPNSYIASDIISGKEQYKEQYTSEQKANFLKHIEGVEEGRDILLGIYSNPLLNSAGL